MRRDRHGVAILVVALGCNITASLGSGEASTGSSSDPLQTTSGEVVQSSSSSGGAAEGTGGLGTTGGSSFGDASSGSRGSSSEGGWSSTTTGSSTGFDDEDLCRSPLDGSCLACIQESCCEAVLECIDDPNCACLLGCLEFAPDFLSCVSIPACQGGFGTQQLATCAGFECTQPCGFPGPPDGDPGFPGEG